MLIRNFDTPRGTPPLIFFSGGSTIASVPPFKKIFPRGRRKTSKSRIGPPKIGSLSEAIPFMLEKIFKRCVNNPLLVATAFFFDLIHLVYA